jgi:cyclase
MKVRVIPTILTDGTTVVKGEQFNNWRTVGSAEAIAKLYARRNVDELLFLDVNARKNGGTISEELIRVFSDVLDIPFAVGGGIDTYEDAARCFRNGAEKVVLGSSAIENQILISQIARGFGSQAVIISLDIRKNESNDLMIHSGRRLSPEGLDTFVPKIESLGGGEILLQNVERDGLMKGMDLKTIKSIASMTNLPIIASSGCGSSEDAISALNSGASAIAAGAVFQFTQLTPLIIRESLKAAKFQTRLC